MIWGSVRGVSAKSASMKKTSAKRVKRGSVSGLRGASALVLGLAAASFADEARAQKQTLSDAAARVAATYDVEVLRSSEVTLPDGSVAYELVVMNKGGDFNEAFQVTRLLVDPADGKLIPRFRHGESGYDLSGAPRYSPGRDGADSMMRRESLR